MVLDSSVVIAILGGESEAGAFREAIKKAPSRLLSVASLVEIGIVTLGRRGEAGTTQMRALVNALRLDVVPVSHDQADLALDAFRRFGKGRHPAGLNFGDCFSYALALAMDEPLLFKGKDFVHTDVRKAVWADTGSTP